MSTLYTETLDKIRKSDDLHIALFQANGKTYGTPTWIWSVVVEDQLYVRAYNGTRSRWYQSAMTQKAGRIQTAGMQIEVAFEPIDDTELNAQIDEAYRAKYADSRYLPPMISERNCAATVQVSPTIA
jgi:Uncharacterized protein conserved in bacteria